MCACTSLLFAICASVSSDAVGISCSALATSNAWFGRVSFVDVAGIRLSCNLVDASVFCLLQVRSTSFFVADFALVRRVSSCMGCLLVLTS